MVMLRAIIHKEEDMYVAECPEIGTMSQGKTIVVSYFISHSTLIFRPHSAVDEPVPEHPLLAHSTCHPR